MKLQDWVKQRTLKIINSKAKVEVKDNDFCQMDLRSDLALSENDVTQIISGLEKYFKILWEDEEIEKLRSVNDIVRSILDHANENESRWIAHSHRIIRN